MLQKYTNVLKTLEQGPNSLVNYDSYSSSAELAPRPAQYTRLGCSLCSSIFDIKPLIDVNRQSLNSLLLFVGREKMSKNPYEIMDPGVDFAEGRC